MDGPKGSTTETVDFLGLLEKRLSNPMIINEPVVQTFKQLSRQCFGQSAKREFPLLDHPSIVLIILTNGGFGASDLARLEATCKFFKNPANFPPHNSLSLPELAALDMCNDRIMFKSMKPEDQNILKQKCGGSWKLVFKFILAGEKACSRRGKSQVVSGCGHSVVVSSQGVVYSFGRNNLGQLGHGTLDSEPRPRKISSLEGIRVVQAEARFGKTMLVSDNGQVYTFGMFLFGEHAHVVAVDKQVSTVPQLVDPLKNIYVIQIAIGKFFTAVLSREGNVYTLCWGKENKFIHQTDPEDLEPCLLDGALENVLVVQISAGFCYLLALAFQPGGMSVYSVGCGLGGKLGHGTTEHEPKARLVEHLHTLSIDPVMISAGSWHIGVLSRDGRMCTWGWGNNGCLGHGNEENVSLPNVIEGLSHVKSIDIATGDYATFVVTEDGDVYSFGCDYCFNLGHGVDVVDGELVVVTDDGCVYSFGFDYWFNLGHGADFLHREERQKKFLTPKIVTSLKLVGDRIVQINATKSGYLECHTLVLTESGKLYALGWAQNGQLGIKLKQNEKHSMVPKLVDISLG